MHQASLRSFVLSALLSKQSQSVHTHREGISRGVYMGGRNLCGLGTFSNSAEHSFFGFLSSYSG